MKFLYDLFPLVLFFAAYFAFDIYVATAVAIVASIVQVIGYWLKYRRFETVQLITLGVVTVFGTITLVTRDPTFVKWKPTIVYWILAGLIAGSEWLGKRSVLDRLLSQQVELPKPILRRLSFSWAGFFLVMGALNLYVAFYFGADLSPETREKIWVYFKFPGGLILTFLFVGALAFYLSPHISEKKIES